MSKECTAGAHGALVTGLEEVQCGDDRRDSFGIGCKRPQFVIDRMHDHIAFGIRDEQRFLEHPVNTRCGCIPLEERVVAESLGRVVGDRINPTEYELVGDPVAQARMHARSDELGATAKSRCESREALVARSLPYTAAGDGLGYMQRLVDGRKESPGRRRVPGPPDRAGNPGQALDGGGIHLPPAVVLAEQLTGSEEGTDAARAEIEAIGRLGDRQPSIPPHGLFSFLTPSTNHTGIGIIIGRGAGWLIRRGQHA
jgi:hypothetical protein